MADCQIVLSRDCAFSLITKIIRSSYSCVLPIFYFRPLSFHGGSSNDGSAFNGLGSFERINEPVTFLLFLLQHGMLIKYYYLIPITLIAPAFDS